MVEHSHTVATAAAEIVALINSSPRSPRQDEIEAVLAKAMAPQPIATARLVELRRAIATVETAEEEAGPGETRTDATQDRIDRLYAPFDAMTQSVWDTLPTTRIDLHERAIIARHWFNVGRADWENPCDLDDWGDQAIAQLIHGVLLFDRSDVAKSHGASAAAKEPKITGPVVIKFDKEEFARHWLSLAEMAVKLLAKDTAGVRAFIENTFSGDFDDEMSGDDALSAFMADLESLSGKCASLSEIARVAWARILAAFPDDDGAPSELFGVKARDGAVLICDPTRQRIQEIRDI